jgi:invasion protein IalB
LIVAKQAGRTYLIAVSTRMKRVVQILLLSMAALPLCSELLGATTEAFSDWVVECPKPAACAAKTFRQGGTIDGYPSLKISGKNLSQRELFLADANILDGSKKVGVRIDSTSLIELEPQRDLKRLSSYEYQVVNDAQRRRLLSRMLSGRKLQLFYTNVRGQEREPEFSLMGMGDALQRLASPPTGAQAPGGEQPAEPSQSKPPETAQAQQQPAVNDAPPANEQPPAAADSAAEQAAGYVDSRSKVVKKFRNWQLRCAEDGACAATTYKAGGAIDGYPVIKVVKDSRNNRQLRIDNAQNINGNKNIWFRVDDDKEIRLLPGKDFTRISTDEYRISNASLERTIMQEILAGSSLRFSYQNTRGQWRQPRYSLLGATAAMNALVGDATDSSQAADSGRAVATAEPRTAAATAPAQQQRESEAAVFDPLDDLLQQNRQADSRSWWQRIGKSGKRWSYSCSGSRCSAFAQGALKSGKNDISMQISGGSKGSRQLMLSGAANLDASKPMRMQIDGSLPLHVVPRKDFSAYGRDDIRIVNARLVDTLVAKMLRGNEMWVTYTNRQGRPRVVKFSLNGMGASLKKLGRGR